MKFQMAKAQEQGLAAGMAKGLAEGRAAGRKEAILETACNLKAKNVATEIIAACTGLSVDEIMEL